MLAILDRQNHILDSANDFAFPAANIIIQTAWRLEEYKQSTL